MGTTDRALAVVVSDAGPLIHLDELACLDVLDFSEVLVPEIVWAEVASHRATALSCTAVRLSRQSDIAASPRVNALAPVFGLRHGEREALALCLARPDALLLTDYSAARLAAKTLAILAHGSIGLILRAVRRGLRTPMQALQLLDDIPTRSTLHVRPSLLDQIKQRAADEWQLPRR
jgi:predicted nucleic acid-binding protein